MIQFSHVPDSRWLLLGGVLVFALLFFSYYFALGKANWLLRSLLITLRLAAIGVVVICLLDPQKVEPIQQRQNIRVAVLVDGSQSMSIADGSENRMALGKNWIAQKFSPEVPANVAISYATFDRALRPVSNLDSSSPTGGVTAIADALDELLAAPSDEPLAGVVLCSDGIENSQRDPEAVARLYRRKGIPIHTVTLGTTNEVRDIILENVQVKRAVPDQAPTRVAITLRSFGFRDAVIPVQIRFQNKIVASENITLVGGSQRAEINFTPSERGFQIYEVSVPTQTGEWLDSNNHRAFGLEVADQTLRVLYMEGTPDEWKYLKEALESESNIKVKALYRLPSGNFGANTVQVHGKTGEKVYQVEHPTEGFPRSMTELLKYDVVINSDIRKESFTAEQLQNTAKFVEEFGGGFVMIGGWSAFGAGGYQKTIVDRVIPVAMEELTDFSRLPFQIKVAPNVLNHPIMALGGNRDESQQIWSEKFPGFTGYNRVDRAKPGATVLVEHSSDKTAYGTAIIFAVQEIGKGRSMAFTSDTTRGWGERFETLWGERINPSLPLTEHNCDARYYRQFWINSIRWLAAGRMGRTNSPVTLELEKTYSHPGEVVLASIKVRDKEMKELSTADVSVVLSSAGKSNVVVKADYDAASRTYKTNLRVERSGDYTVIATAAFQNEKLGQDKQLLSCETADLEMTEVRANPDLMAKIARASGGKTFSANQQESESVEEIFANIPPVTVEYRHTPLWDKAWALGLIVALLSAEWIIRRLRGLA